MSLQSLDNAIGANFRKAITADVEGRPVEVRAQLVDIQALITEFLGKQATAKEEPVNEPEEPGTVGHCMSDEVHEDSGDPKEKQEELGDNKTPAADAAGD